MAGPHTERLEGQRVEGFLDQWSPLALAATDLHDPDGIGQLLAELSPAELAAVKAHQRLYRIISHSGAGATVKAVRGRAAALIERGLGSAQEIAAIPPSRFVADHGDTCGGAEAAAEIHRRAVQVRAAVRHLVANIRDAASPYVAQLLGPAFDPGIRAYFEKLPGYQDLFGNLDYLACAHCDSIFGPAAYFLDVMRITDRYITEPSRSTIPDHWTLRERRPDLFDSLELTCANTDNPVAYVTLVVEILLARLRRDLADPVAALASAVYPFGLPFNEPLARITTTLAHTGSSYAAAVSSMLAVQPRGFTFDSIVTAAPVLGLSPEQVATFTTPAVSDHAVAAQYGLSQLVEHLPAAGPGSIAVTAGERVATGGDGRLGTVVVVGQQIGLAGPTPTVPKAVRTVTEIVSGDTVVVDEPWSETATGVPYVIFPLEDLSTVTCLRYRASISSYDDLVSLLRQALSPTEIATGASRKLYVNATGEPDLPDLAILEGSVSGDRANPVARIVGYSAKRLDRVSRLLRLSRATTIPVDVLDWLIERSGGEISAAFLVRLASLLRLAEAMRLPLVDTAGFVFELKAIGRQSATILADPFDRIFNPPSLRVGLDPYTAPNPIPFDPGRPLRWLPAAGPTWTATNGTVRAATTTTVTLADNASAHEGAYDGFALTIVGGRGQGQAAVIKTYAGPSRTATIWAPWTTLPDTTSSYQVAAVPALTERLAAALRVPVSDLSALGQYLAAGLGTPEAPLVLDLANLTALWRLAAAARSFALTPADYLNLRAAAGLPARPPVEPDAALDQMAEAVSAATWLASTDFDVADLDYVISGARSRALRVAYDPASLLPAIEDMARVAAGSAVTAASFNDLVSDPDAGQAILDALMTDRFIDVHGVVLSTRDQFTDAARHFPIGPGDLADAVVSGKEAEVVVAELRGQHPPYLIAQSGELSTLGYDYPPGSTLPFLFAAVADAPAKRTRVAQVLDAKALAVGFTEFAKFVPVRAVTGFVGPGVGSAQSEAVFSVLDRLQVILPTGAGEGALSADWTPETALPGLFESAARGQARIIAGYDPANRTATVEPVWAISPDAFSCYRVVGSDSAGNARSGTPRTLQLAEAASPVDGAYVGAAVVLLTGPGAGDFRTVVGYDGATRTATVEEPWSATPTIDTAYQVGPVLASGSARRGSATTIQFSDDASAADGAYQGSAIALVADAELAAKVSAVRQTLGEVKRVVTGVREVVAGARVGQIGVAAQGLAPLLAVPLARIPLLLPFTTGEFDLEPYLPGLLSRPPAGIVPAATRRLAEGLSRASVAASRAKLSDDALAGLARRPARYGVDLGGATTFESLRNASAVGTFASSVGSDAAAVVAYFDVAEELVGEDGKRNALQYLTSWPAAQTEAIGAYLAGSSIAWSGIGTLAGVLRLASPLAAMDALAADGSYLVRLAELAKLPPLLATGDDAQWQQYQATADATTAVLGVRYRDNELTIASDQVARALASLARDALVGFTIAHLQRLQPPIHPPIRLPADLLAYLLIDVETSGCDTTSRIAQAITSVQLYMQRVRMGVEPGADTTSIAEVWWSWISTYRLWEANRRVFLYPENYLEPALRKDASPQFEDLVNELMQGRPTEENVARAMVNYIDGFAEVASLTHVAGCKVGSVAREGNQIDEPSYFVARTNTTPYRYFVRSFTRSLLPDQLSAGTPAGEMIVWQPWLRVDATIDSPEVTPVVAFDRLFLFWNEIAPTKSSRVATVDGKTPESQTESVWQATLRYTFQASTNTWVSSQELKEPLAIRTLPNDYAPLLDPYVANAFGSAQAYWQRPFAQQVARGIPATGTLTFGAGSSRATGDGTVLERQIVVGDSVWVAGEEKTVSAVDAKQQSLAIVGTFTIDGAKAPFKVVPRDTNIVRFMPFPGPGRVELNKVLTLVTGYDTRFVRDFAVGDAVQVGNETRLVVAIFGETLLHVDRPWTASSDEPGIGQVVVFPRLNTVDGVGTDFTGQLHEGDEILVLGQKRTIGSVEGPEQLLVTQAFDVDKEQRAPFSVRRYFAYTSIPRTRGDERLMVFYGPNFDLQAKLPTPADAGQTANPGADPFITSRNQFNQNLFAALNLSLTVHASYGALVRGDVTAQPTLILDDAFDQQAVRLFAPAYDGRPTATSAPVRVALDDENGIVYARPEPRPLVGLYWGNTTPGSSQNQERFVPPDRPLAYHVTASSFLYGLGNQIGWYLLNTMGQSFWIARNDPKSRTTASTTFVRPFVQPEGPADLEVAFGPYTLDRQPFADTTYRFTRLNTSVVQRLKGRLLVGGFDRLLALDSQMLSEPPFDEFYEIPKTGTPPPAVDCRHLPPDTMDFGGAYGLYFWEIFFHAPLLVAQQLKDNLRFEDAQHWYSYIYNPNAQPTDANENFARYWRFRPFREGMTIPGLREVLSNPFEINTYNDDPFNPDAIARLRISAYAKTTVLKYIDNLIRWGDSLFRLDTRESVAQATNLYMLANDLLGKRPEVVGKLPPRAPKTFDQIHAEYPGGIPQFLIELENSKFVPLSGEGARFADVPINDINAYFCVPENAELTAYWDRIEDRLYKIRHCLNIDGVERVLALFAPAIDPRQAIAAFGGEQGGIGVGTLGSSPLPGYRFSFLIGYAKSLADSASQLASSLLRALESRDVEALAELRLHHEARMLDMTLGIRSLQTTAIDEERDALQAGRDSAQQRSAYYHDLLATGYISSEIAQIVYLMSGMVTQGLATILKTASAIGFALPQVGSPFAMTYGGQQVGGNIEQAGAALDSATQTLSTGAEVLGIAAMHARRVEEWTLQETLANFDVAQFDAQLQANATQKEIAKQERAVVETSITQNAAVEEFYRTRFTTSDLYQWMASRLASTYYQTYQLALDMGRMAQRALQYELSTDIPAVASTWSDQRLGLTAADSLQLALNQLEATQVNANTRRRYEITRTISLATIDPVAFLSFVETGEAIFEFNERLFDSDFPGQYLRRVKTVSVTIPALVGPYQNVSAILTQTANRVIREPSLEAVRFLLGDDVAVGPGLIEHNVRANQSIAISLAGGDAGVFDDSADSSLLLPFEKTGAVSSWKLSMPPANNPLQFGSISDVVFELRYTAVDGGAQFRSKVAALPQVRERAWTSASLLARQFPDEWYSFMSGPISDQTQQIDIDLTNLARPNVDRPAIVAYYLRLVVAEGTSTTSRTPYVTVSAAGTSTSAFSPATGHAYSAAFPKPVALTAGATTVEVSFDLRPGATPTAMRSPEGDRISSRALQDIELVLFLSGLT